jgi:hypothetical protein
MVGFLLVGLLLLVGGCSFRPSAGSPKASQPTASVVPNASAKQNATPNKTVATSFAWHVFTVPTADARAQSGVYQTLLTGYGLTSYPGSAGQIALDATPGTPGGGAAWFGYDPASGVWRYHFASREDGVFIGASGIWAVEHSRDGSRWTLSRWQNGHFQANPALGDIPEFPPGNSSGWFGDGPVPSGGMYLHFRDKQWFQGRLLLRMGDSLTGEAKGSVIVIPVGSGVYYRSIGDMRAVPSGTDLILISPHHLRSLGFDPAKGFSQIASFSGDFVGGESNNLDAVGDGQGGAWYFSGNQSSPLLSYWRAGLAAPMEWPVPSGALARGWGQGLIPGTHGVWLVRWGGYPHQRYPPAEEAVPSRVYAFDAQTGTWHEPALPSWWWNARGSGLVAPLPDGDLLAIGSGGEIGLLSPTGVFQTFSPPGWPSGYMINNNMVIDSAGNAWLTAYQGKSGEHHWILVELTCSK